jgi:hypothetical protein
VLSLQPRNLISKIQVGFRGIASANSIRRNASMTGRFGLVALGCCISFLRWLNGAEHVP